MGYTTDFNGEFSVTPPLQPQHIAYLDRFAATRRMKRNDLVFTYPDPLREAVGLPVGLEGSYFVADDCYEHPTIVDYNSPPINQPGLWCQWVPSPDGQAICWDGNEKFYEYVDWIRYLIDHFLAPWGYTLNGEVYWQGEEPGDVGIINIESNVVRIQDGHIVYDPIDAPIEELNEGDNAFVWQEGGLKEQVEKLVEEGQALLDESESFTPHDIELLKYAVNFTKLNLDYECEKERGVSCEELEKQLEALGRKLGNE